MSRNETQSSKDRLTFACRYRNKPGSRAETEAVYRQLAAFIRRILGSEATSTEETTALDFERAKAKRKHRKRRAS